MNRLRLWKTLTPCLLLVIVCGVGSTPGVQVLNHTYCSKNSTIQMNLDCDNSFSIGDECYARVHRQMDIEDVRDPFKFHKDDGTMEVLQPVNFTHRSLCHLGDDKEMEKIENYESISCSEPDPTPDSAAATQGPPLFILLTVAVVYVMKLGH